MSIYGCCSQALRGALDADGLVTDWELVRAAAREQRDESDYVQADRDAAQVLATRNRDGLLVRFGVVSADAPLTTQPDYVRRDGRVLYGLADRWEARPLQTPNGPFRALTYRRDPLRRPGARRCKRDDFRLWASQDPAHVCGVCGQPLPGRSVTASTLRA